MTLFLSGMLLTGRLTLLEDVATLLAVLVLLSSGAAIIARGATERTRQLARRVDKVRWQPGAAKTVKAGWRPEERLALQGGLGLLEAEHRQIIRAFSRLRVPPEWAFACFNAARFILLLGASAVTLLLVPGFFPRSQAVALLAAASAAALGWFVPIMLVRHAIAQHASAVASGLPDALELLAMCVEAGLSLEGALQRVARELTASKPELAGELAQTWAEINILPDRDQAFLNLAARVNIPVVRSVVGTLSQTLRYGTPLAASLRTIAADVRVDQLTELEEKANRLPALMTVPVMLFIMPTIFLIIGGPAALKLMDVFAARGGH
jgi:tight adherence protein C